VTTHCKEALLINIQDNKGATVFHNMGQRGALQCLKLLVVHCQKMNVDIDWSLQNMDHNEPLGLAIWHGYYDFVMFLVSEVRVNLDSFVHEPSVVNVNLNVNA
jgi:hypothetical protein